MKSISVRPVAAEDWPELQVVFGTRNPSAGMLFHGTLSTFVAAGFEEVARTSASRPIVRLRL